MNSKKVLEIANKKLAKDFGASYMVNAAKHFGVTYAGMRKVLLNQQKHVPKYLLDYIGYELKQPEYVKKV